MGVSFKTFAQMFVRTRNPSEAAVRVGIPPEVAKTEGEKLLENSKVISEISRLERGDRQTLAYVKSGLSRIAFGSVNDAVALMFDENVTPEQIMKADLFNVAEIKRDKSKIEIRFWDRQKALEKLVELEPQLKEVSDAENFLKAIYGGSRRLDNAETEVAQSDE